MDKKYCVICAVAVIATGAAIFTSCWSTTGVVANTQSSSVIGTVPITEEKKMTRSEWDLSHKQLIDKYTVVPEKVVPQFVPDLKKFEAYIRGQYETQLHLEWQQIMDSRSQESKDLSIKYGIQESKIVYIWSEYDYCKVDSLVHPEQYKVKMKSYVDKDPLNLRVEEVYFSRDFKYLSRKLIK